MFLSSLLFAPKMILIKVVLLLSLICRPCSKLSSYVGSPQLVQHWYYLVNHFYSQIMINLLSDFRMLHTKFLHHEPPDGTCIRTVRSVLFQRLEQSTGYFLSLSEDSLDTCNDSWVIRLPVSFLELEMKSRKCSFVMTAPQVSIHYPTLSLISCRLSFTLFTKRTTMYIFFQEANQGQQRVLQLGKSTGGPGYSNPRHSVWKAVVLNAWPPPVGQ